jgi:hypothetical protein
MNGDWYNMATKRELTDVVGKGNWDYSNGEYRCAKCGSWQFTGKHEDDCPLGIVLELIEKSDFE